MSVDSHKRARFLTLGLAAVAGSSIPAYLQHRFSEDGAFWAGAPLALLGVGLIFRTFMPGRHATEPSGAMAGVTFRELSAWTSIAAILAVYGLYTVRLLNAPPTVSEAIRALVGSTFLMIAVSVASHLLLIVARRPEEADERDREIDLLAARNAHLVLAVGIWGVMLIALLQLSFVLIAYAAMGVFVVSELARLGSSIFYYRTAL